ncbi:MAG: nucleotide exchange factor GrpE [bacterium]
MKDDDIKNDVIENEVDTDPGDDVVFEENTEVTGVDAQIQVKKLKERIKELEKKNAELLDSWQRDKADFLNARRSDAENQKKFAIFAKEDIITELLQTLDSFESAFKNKESWEKVDENWRKGVEYIHSQLAGALSQHGLSVVNPLGEKFDHNRDEAIETVPVENENDDQKILEVVTSGYKLHDKLIRAPKVKVAEYKEKSQI